MRRSYGMLFLGLLALGVGAAASGVVFLESSSKADVNAEVGKWLLTLAVGLVITGALSAVVKQIDQRRTERDAWQAVLNDVVAANQSITLARLRLLAHQSARTYHEQLAELMGIRAELRRIRAMNIVVADPPLRERLTAMQDYLDELGREYQKGYLWVSRQQRLDEVWLTAQMDFAKQATRPPRIRRELAESPTAWNLLRTPERFPRLARLLDDQVFKIDVLRGNYKLAKGRLETHAGFQPRSRTAASDAARKLSDRANEFLKDHPNLPDKVAGSIKAGVAELDRRRDGARPDIRAINAATLSLNTALAEAIDTLFTATEESTGTGNQTRPSPSPI